MSQVVPDNNGTPLARVLHALGPHRRRGDSYVARCPAHDDTQPSLSVREGLGGKVLLRCFAGCSAQDVVSASGLSMSDLFVPSNDNGQANGPRSVPQSLTLEEFAAHKQLPRDVLTFYGVRDGGYFGRPCVEFDYVRLDGAPARTRLRLSLTGSRFRWKGQQGETVAYAPDRCALARTKGYVILCEGESDTLTLLYQDFPAIGLPGADTARLLQIEHLAEVERVFIVHEPDQGGDSFVAGARLRLTDLSFAGGVHELKLPHGCKDPSALFQRDEVAFASRLRELLDAASTPPRPTYKLLSEALRSELKPIARRLTTGFRSLDQATRGGIPLGRVVVLAGAPGAAKTSLAVHLVHQWERTGCACVYLASDEPAEGILVRLGQLMGFSRTCLESEGDAGDAVRAGVSTRSAGRPIAVIDPDADPTMRTIEDAERALLHLAANLPRVLVVDSLQTAECAGAAAAESLRERIDAKLSVAKAIAKRGTLVLAISEMSRAGYRSGSRTENISALAASKESGSIEYGAALLLGLRSVPAETGLVDVEVAKNRLGGSKPEFRLRLDFDRASFAEVDLPAKDEGPVTAESKATAARARVLAAVRKRHDLRSANEINAAAGGDRTSNLEAIRELRTKSVLVMVGGFFLIAAPTQEEP